MPLASEPRICNDNRHRSQLNILYIDSHVNARGFKELKPEDFRLDLR